MQGYYQPRFPAGEARLREIYAESAFFTWRLLRVFFWALLLLTLIIAAGAFVALYGLVVQSPTDENVKRAILETLCSVTVAIFGMKAAEQTIEVFGQASSVRSVADALIRAPLPCGKVLGELVDDYDIQMSAGKDPPTLLWVLMRSSLNEQWNRRREALGPVPPTATSSAEQ
ncbi:MAG: hypothetical protein KF878_01250 [Planctomycetes bacterium]|nr:hypothetical protein [Planctomycetota bacterium]